MHIEVAPRRFVEVWQKAEYVSDVAQKLRISKGACRMRAWRYRNHHGIPLKELPTTRPAEAIDWDELAEYARELAPVPDAVDVDKGVTDTPDGPEGGAAGEVDVTETTEVPIAALHTLGA